MRCLNGDRDTLRPEETPAPRTTADTLGDVLDAMADGSAALRLVARKKTGWPPPLPVAAGPG